MKFKKHGIYVGEDEVIIITHSCPDVIKGITFPVVYFQMNNSHINYTICKYWNTLANKAAFAFGIERADKEFNDYGYLGQFDGNIKDLTGMYEDLNYIKEQYDRIVKEMYELAQSKVVKY